MIAPAWNNGKIRISCNLTRASAPNQGISMKTNKRHSRSAFTLVEIMIVVAIIGILAVLAVPQFIRSRQLSQGRVLVNDARQIDSAIHQWALQFGKVTGDTVNSASISVYLKTGPLQSKVAALGVAGGDVTDVLKIPSITISNVGSAQVRITSAAKTALTTMRDWGDF
jgi:prepilin-type N-terminal cleavage/methylation domain-containing protein